MAFLDLHYCHKNCFQTWEFCSCNRSGPYPLVQGAVLAEFVDDVLSGGAVSSWRGTHIYSEGQFLDYVEPK